MYEIFQVIIKYLNKKTLCRLRTVSHEVHDYIKKPKPFKEEKLRRQRNKNILNQNINMLNEHISPTEYFHINKVIHHCPQSKSIIYKIGSENLYSLFYYNSRYFPFNKKKEYYSRYSKSFKNKINSCRCKE